MSEELGTSVDPPAEGKTGAASLTAEIMKNPALLAALTRDLASIRGQQSTYISSLPEVIKRRIRALKNIQVECQHVEARFMAEVQALERRFASDYQQLYTRRRDIVLGKYEPKEEETHFAPDEDLEADEEEDEAESSDKAGGPKAIESAADSDAPPQYDENTKGIPEFWLTAMKNVDEIASQIQDHDEEVLRHLEDITLELVEQPLGFNLEFHFGANEYFSDTVLKKSYKMKIAVDETDPWSFNGPEIVSSKGCDINWKKGKNMTVKTIKKKQKNKNKGQTRVITKQVKADSFFNFFSPPAAPVEGEEFENDDEAADLDRDFEMGSAFRDNVIPRAVLFFTGEAVTEEDYDEDFEDDGSMADDNDEDEDADPDYKPPAGGNPEECKQQ